jgi:hypothetical protein
LELEAQPDRRTGNTIAEPIKKKIRREKLLENKNTPIGTTVQIRIPKERDNIGATE